MYPPAELPQSSYRSVTGIREGERIVECEPKHSADTCFSWSFASLYVFTQALQLYWLIWILQHSQLLSDESRFSEYDFKHRAGVSGICSLQGGSSRYQTHSWGRCSSSRVAKGEKVMSLLSFIRPVWDASMQASLKEKYFWVAAESQEQSLAYSTIKSALNCVGPEAERDTKTREHTWFLAHRFIMCLKSVHCIQFNFHCSNGLTISWNTWMEFPLTLK